MAKEDWEKTGKELGGAFQGLAKSLIRSAKQGIEDAEEWAESEGEAAQEAANEQEQKSTVFNDGTWRETGKNLGHAFQNLGKTILNAGEEATDNKDE